MSYLILGLILFLVPHSVRIVADGWRSAQVARIGLPAWKGIYSLVSLAGLALVVWGYGQARMAPVVLWDPPLFTRHLSSLFTLAAFVLLAAAYVPRNRIRAVVGHPMLAGVKLWAFGHLLANGTLADLLLFGAFLAWAILAFRAARRRDRAVGPLAGAQAALARPQTSLAADLATAAAGVFGWALFAFMLHGWLIGVRPF